MNYDGADRAERRVLVFGGTSDSLAVCEMLRRRNIVFTLSVATDAGKSVAECYRNDIRLGRLDADQITALLRAESYALVIDAGHPYAYLLHRNVAIAAGAVGLPVLRLERHSQIDAIEHSLIHRVPDIPSACVLIRSLGMRVLLTTGSKELASYVVGLPEKYLIARVLPTHDVIEQCEQLGLQLDQIIAMKGPFSAAFNQALYHAVKADVVVTKESGSAGGFLEKVQPCIDLGIPCVVIERPATSDDEHIFTMTTLDELEHTLCSRLLEGLTL